MAGSIGRRAVVADDGDERVQGRTLRDRGQSFVELLVAIVLLGTAVIAVLAGVRATIIGSTTEHDHSRAQVWLQSAMETLDRTPRVGCDPIDGVPTDPKGTYQAAIRAAATPVEGWTPNPQLSVLSVTYWDGTTYVSDACSDDAGFLLQLVKIQVTSPDGDIVEDVEVVKDATVS